MIAEQIRLCTLFYTDSSKSTFLRDSFSLDMAQLYASIHRNDLSVHAIRNISPSPLFSESKKELLLSLLIECKEFETAQTQLSFIQSKQFKNDASLSLLMLSGKPLHDTLLKNNSPCISDLTTRYRNKPKYSSFTAGALSAVLPGAGKWYVGNRRQAFSSFLGHLFLAAQAWESYHKAGVSSTRFALTSAAFGVFYIGNVWGSVLAARKKKRDIRNQIRYDIVNYYADRTGEKVNGFVLPDATMGDSLLKKEIDFLIVPDSLKSKVLLEKSAIYDSKTYSERIDEELQRASSFATNDSLKKHIQYRRMLNFFLSDKFNYCLMIELNKKDAALIGKEKEYIAMKLLAYNETEQWQECKQELLEYLTSPDSVMLKEIEMLPMSYKFIQPQQCSRLSSILPGLGMVRAGKPLKGMLSFAIQSGTLLFTAYQIYSGYYITSVVSGFFPFSKFYSGGKRLSERVAYRRNEEQSNQLKKRYSYVIKQVLMQ